MQVTHLLFPANLCIGAYTNMPATPVHSMSHSKNHFSEALDLNYRFVKKSRKVYSEDQPALDVNSSTLQSPRLAAGAAAGLALWVLIPESNPACTPSVSQPAVDMCLLVGL